VEKALLVPLISKESKLNWGSQQDSKESLIVISIPWEKMMDEFPKLAAAGATDSTMVISESDFVQFDEILVHTTEDDIGVTFLSDAEEGAVNKWQSSNAYSSAVVAAYGAEPLSAGGSVGGTVFGVILLGTGVFCIKKRRETRSLENIQNGLAALLQGASETALRMLARDESPEKVEHQVRQELKQVGYPETLTETVVPSIMKNCQEMLRGPKGDEIRASV
jgi:hypothetical protein